MAMTPQTVVNDDGTGTTGTVWNAAFELALEASIDAAIAAAVATSDAAVRTVPKGGTGVATLTSNGVVIGNGASAVTVTAEGATGTFLGGITGADPAFRAVVESDVTNLVTDLAAKAPLASPALTGVPTAPTAGAGTSTTQLATTAFATTADALKAPLAAPSFTGTVASAGLLDLSGAAAGQIKFPATQNVSADVNTLDDYEEGTWTPTDVSGAGLTLASGTGTYTKVGRVVAVAFSLQYPATASGLAAAIGGLPFTSGTFQGALTTVYTDYGAGIMHFIAAVGTQLGFFTMAAVAITNANFSGKIVRATGMYFV